MKRVSLIAAAIAAVGFSAAAAAEEAEIFAPMPDEKVFSNTLGLVAVDPNAPANSVQWAVRVNNEGCSAGASNIYNIFGNVDGMDDPYEWTGGTFGSTLDISGLEAGEYCFVFNTTAGPAAGVRLVQDFYIVDTYAKVSGGFRLPNATVKGNSPSYTFDGYIADAGDAGFLGSIFVNYREIGVTCSFGPGDTTFIEILPPGVPDHPVGTRAILNNLLGQCSDGASTSNARFFILEKDSVLGNRTGGEEDAPRGAVVVRWTGAPSTNNALEIDATPGSTGVNSWYILERGNGVVGVR